MDTSISMSFVSFLSCVGSLGIACSWAFNTFETKASSKEKIDHLYGDFSDIKHMIKDMHEDIKKTQQDVAYIRGKMAQNGQASSK